MVRQIDMVHHNEEDKQQKDIQNPLLDNKLHESRILTSVPSVSKSDGIESIGGFAVRTDTILTDSSNLE